MKAILSRQPDGRYMLTRFEPLLGIPRGLSMKRRVFYPRFRDPIAYHYMCPEATKALCGGRALEPGQCVVVDVKIEWQSEPIRPACPAGRKAHSEINRLPRRLKNKRLMSSSVGCTKTTGGRRRA
jgi:hypothetical protein